MSVVLAVLVIASLMVNKEVWLQDYPPDVKAKWGPMSQKAKRQRVLFLLPFLGVVVVAMTCTVVRLKLVLGADPAFLALFAAVAIEFAVFNLVDAVIIDWLVLMVLWPGLAVLPGTEGMSGYRDTRLWTKNFLKGFVFALIAGVLVAGLSRLFFLL